MFQHPAGFSFHLKIKMNILLLLKDGCLFCFLALIFWQDLKTQIIPNVYIAGLLLNWLIFPGSLEFVLKRAAAAVFLLIPAAAVSLLYKKSRQRMGLGAGDLKLIFAAGLYLGFFRGLWMILLSCLAFLFTVLLSGQSLRTQKRFSFGPFLALFIACCYFPISSVFAALSRLM